MTEVTRSETETRALARRIAARLKGGEVIALIGPLGSGKTRFVQGLAAGLGFKGGVASPTFTIARQYKGRLRLNHLDLFRLDSSDLPGIGIEDFLDDPGAATAIEWADVAGDSLPLDRLQVTLTPLDGESRRLALKAFGPVSRRLIAP